MNARGVLLLLLGWGAWAAANPYQLIDQGKSAQALEQVQALLAQHPDNAELWYVQGLAKETLHDLAGAALAYRHSLRLQPMPVTAVRLARVYSVCNRHDDAIALLEEMLAQRDDAQLRADAARLYRGAFNYRDAVRHLEAALALDPKRAEDWSELLDLYTVLGDFAALRAALPRCRAALGDAPMLDYYEGRAEMADNRLDEAIRRMDGALQRFATPFPMGWVYYAQALTAAGRAGEAESIARRVVEENPELAAAYYALGRALTKQGKLDEARKTLELYRLLRGESEAGWKDLPASHGAYAAVHEKLAQRAILAGEIDAATDHAMRALSAQPGRLQAMLLLCQGWREAGEAQRALALALQLETRIGADAAFHMMLSDLYRETGNEAESQRRRELACNLRPKICS